MVGPPAAPRLCSPRARLPFDCALCRDTVGRSSAVDGDIERPEDIEYCGHKEFDEEPNANAELISQLATTCVIPGFCIPAPARAVRGSTHSQRVRARSQPENAHRLGWLPCRGALHISQDGCV